MNALTRGPNGCRSSASPRLLPAPNRKVEWALKARIIFFFKTEIDLRGEVFWVVTQRSKHSVPTLPSRSPLRENI